MNMVAMGDTLRRDASAARNFGETASTRAGCMATPTLIPTNLPTIMQAAEQQMLNFTSPITNQPIAGDISNIYWVEEDNEPPPAETGQRDILLAMLGDTPVNVQGDMRFTLVKSGHRSGVK